MKYRIVYLCMYTDGCDDSNNGVLIGAVVGVDCVVIIIMVITNIIIWLYCFRKRQYIGMTVITYAKNNV